MNLFSSIRKQDAATSAYTKAVWVIESCENKVQLDNAKRYCNNFFQHFSKPGGKTLYGMDIIESTPFIETCYIRLQRRIKEKQTEFLT